jgi:hypothetical protein
MKIDMFGNATNRAMGLDRDKFRLTLLILDDKARERKRRPMRRPSPWKSTNQLQCAGAGGGHGVNGAVPPFTVSTVGSGKL